LARYGLAVDYFEYTNTIIEREYQERVETVRQIEIEISELTKVIAELTTKINIERYSSEKILEEIRVKKERVRILKERLYALLISLRKS
jgi:flagellar motility protein MotE (MotC chaperone)